MTIKCLNSFDHQATVLDWDLEDDESPTNQVPKYFYHTSKYLEFNDGFLWDFSALWAS